MQIIIEEKNQVKMVDFLLELGFSGFYSFGLKQYLSQELLEDEKNKVNGYRDCVCFVLLIDKGKKKLSKQIQEKFKNVEIIA